MKQTKSVGFAIIERDGPIDKNIVKIFRKAYATNLALFKRPPKKFRIIICETEAKFREEAKYYFQKWATATVLRNQNLITRSPDFIEKIGRWKRRDFQNLMNHEMNHVFWGSLYKTTKPSWLSEGLACHVGNNFILKKAQRRELAQKYTIDPSLLDYRYLRRKYKSGHVPKYPLWANFTRHLIQKYSERRIIGFMDRYSKNPCLMRYGEIFERIFGKNIHQLFEEFMKDVGD